MLRGTMVLVACSALVGTLSAQPAKGPSLGTLRGQLARAEGDEIAKLEAAIGTMFSAEALAAGTAKPKVEGLLALFAASGPGSWSVAECDAKDALVKRHPMRKGTAVSVAFVELANFSDRRFAVEISYDGGKWERKSVTPLRTETYPTHSDSIVKPDVPKGTVTKHAWKSQIFAGTERDYWVYVPAQYKPEAPACLMVFQDGDSYIRGANVPTVYDNLIHRGELPVTVCVFINPGTKPQPRGEPFRNRSIEYDTLSDTYARFLRDEILPEVSKTVKLRGDANSRGICGRSSGGICAFTVAWEMPDQFGKVLSTIGSFTNIRGGDVYPGKIRKTPAKPIRVYLQDGNQDLDNEHGNWWLANQQMAKALEFKGYDYTFVTGEGFHSGKHEAAILPDALRWLWRDAKP